MDMTANIATKQNGHTLPTRGIESFTAPKLASTHSDINSVHERERKREGERERKQITDS